MSPTTAKSPAAATEPWQRLHQLLPISDGITLEMFIDSLPPWEQARAVSRLSEPDQKSLLTKLPPLRASELLEIIHTTQAVDLLAELEPQQAAVIMDGREEKVSG